MVRQINLGGSRGMSLHQQKPPEQFHFDILRQLKSATVHRLREVLSLPGGRGC